MGPLCRFEGDRQQMQQTQGSSLALFRAPRLLSLLSLLLRPPACDLEIDLSLTCWRMFQFLKCHVGMLHFHTSHLIDIAVRQRLPSQNVSFVKRLSTQLDSSSLMSPSCLLDSHLRGEELRDEERNQGCTSWEMRGRDRFSELCQQHLILLLMRHQGQITPVGLII